MHRARVVDLLRRCIRRSLTVVVAPAGYGKTVAVRQLVDTTPVRGVVVAAEPRDDGIACWHKVVTAVRAAGVDPDPAEVVDAHDDRAALAALLDGAARLVEPLVVVVDELHRVRHSFPFRHLETVVNRLPPLLRFVAVSRAQLPLPMALWRAQRTVAEVGADQLQLQPAEALALFRRRGRDLSPDDVGKLNLRAEGWPIGVHLLALTASGPASGPPFPDALMRGLVDYVLAGAEPDVRDFVVTTSVLGHVGPDLARAATGRGDAGRLLRAAVEDNLFATKLSDDPEHGVRFRALFTELMSWALEQRRPGAASELHMRAAAWHEEAGEPELAMGHLVAGGLVDEVPGRVGRRAVDALRCGLRLDAAACLAGVAEVLPALRSAPALDILRQHLLAVAGDCRLLVDDLEGVERDCVAMTRDRPTDLVLDLVVPALRARLELRRGLLRRAETLARATLRSAGRRGLRSHPAVGDAERAMGGVLAEWGRRRDAAACFARAVTVATALERPVVAAAVRLDAIAAGVVGADPREALHELVGLRRSLDALAVGPALLARAVAVEAGLRIAAGELDRADELVAAMPTGTTTQLLAARLALARGDAGRVPDLVASASPARRHDRVVAELLVARAAAMEQRPWERDQHLLAAARLAAPEGHVATFGVEAPGLVGRLRELATADPDASTVIGRLDQVDTGRRQRSTHEAPTERELVVLRHLPSSMTMPEIAAELEISANTLKTHARSLYRKLGVRSRADAVAAARRAGIL